MQRVAAAIWAGLVILACGHGSQASPFRFGSIKAGQTEFGVMAAYGRNHRIPSSAKQTFSFDGAKIRYGWFTSPRSEIGVDFAYEHLNGSVNCDSLTGTVSYRRYFLVRGRTALSFDAGLGVTWYDGKFGLLGTKTNFTELLGLTFQRGMGPASALNVEYRFTHTSNAGTATPNLGVNASTIAIGVSWFP